MQKEIETAVGFSKKAAALVDKIKRKDSKEVQDSDDENDYSDDLKKTSKPIPPPKQTALSLQRMVNILNKDHLKAEVFKPMKILLI